MSIGDLLLKTAGFKKEEYRISLHGYTVWDCVRDEPNISLEFNAFVWGTRYTREQFKAIEEVIYLYRATLKDLDT